MDICYGSRIGQTSAIGVTFAVFQRVQCFLSIRMGIWFMALLNNADFHDIRISGPCILVNLAYGDSRLYSFKLGNMDKSLRFTVPVSGVYTLVWSSPFLECTEFSVDGGSVTGKSVEGTWKQYQSEGYKWTVSSGSNVYANFVGSRYTNQVELSGSDRRIIAIRTPVWKVVPASTVIINNYQLCG